MIASFYTDNVDCTTQYGLSIGENSYAQLITWPALKAIEATDWHEEDGTDPDLGAPALDSREFTLRFVGNTTRAKVDAFIALWRNGVYHLLSTGIGRKYQLRLVGNGKPRWVDGLCILDLKFADDFPLYAYTYETPTSTIVSSDDYLLDGTRLTDYGVILLDGAHDQLMQTPPVKRNLATSLATKAGLSYDSNGAVTYGAYEARITCLMRAKTLDELWQNYDALLVDLVRPNRRTLTATALGKAYPFHYVTSRVRRFYPDGKIWLEFDITINVFGTPEDIE